MGRRVRFTREELEEAIRNARSCSEALRALGYRPAGGNHATLAKYAKQWEISTDHFDPYWASRNGRPERIPLSEIYHPNYYGAFVLDPDGNNVEAVCHLPA